MATCRPRLPPHPLVAAAAPRRCRSHGRLRSPAPERPPAEAVPGGSPRANGPRCRSSQHPGMVAAGRPRTCREGAAALHATPPFPRRAAAERKRASKRNAQGALPAPQGLRVAGKRPPRPNSGLRGRRRRRSFTTAGGSTATAPRRGGKRRGARERVARREQASVRGGKEGRGEEDGVGNSFRRAW